MFLCGAGIAALLAVGFAAAAAYLRYQLRENSTSLKLATTLVATFPQAKRSAFAALH
jgi:hypothetical protein